MRLDFRPDQIMLEGACVSYERAAMADEMVTKHGLMIREPLPSGGFAVRTNPAIAISNAAWRNVRAFCSEFGLSPVSRTRLTIEDPGNPTEDLMKLLSQPRQRRKEIVQ